MQWVKLCVTTASFSILVNRRPQGGYFQPQRGIKQGCPLALLYFLLAANALATCTIRLCSRGYLSGFQTAGTPEGIPLLQYADDTTFFIQGPKNAARTLSSMTDIFSNFSGLQLNRDKYIFVGFELSIEEASRCVEHLATPIEGVPGSIPGSTVGEQATSRSRLAAVLEKVEARLGGWQARMLSRGGRLVLVKAVLSAIPTYFMSVFRMPAWVRRQIEGAMRNFFLARDRCHSRGRPSRLEYGMSASHTWWPWRTPSSTHQHGTIE